MPRQSILLSSFQPLKPIVQTKDSESQTDESTPIKHFQVMETQTDAVESASVRIQTENNEMKESQVQTSSILTDTVEVQTDKAQLCHAEG